MMPENTTSNIESNTIRTVTTTIAAHMIAPIRMGIVTFLPPDAQYVEPTDTDV